MATPKAFQLDTALPLGIRTEEAASIWQDAVQAAGTIVERSYRIGDIVICLQFAGETLVPQLTRALDHLPKASGEAAAFTLKIWDATTTGTAFPAFTMPEIQPLGNPRYLLRKADRLAMFQPVDGTLSILDHAHDQGYFWVTDKSRLSYGEEAAPFRFLLGTWLASRGLYLVHAAAVGTVSGGVLLVGKSGSGKSTAALSCLGSTLGYASDDNVLVSPGPQPMVYSLFNAGKLRPDNIDRFAHLVSRIPAEDISLEDKTLMFVDEHDPRQILLQCPLRAILVARYVGRRESALRPASPVEAMIALAPSTIFQLPGSGQSILDVTKHLVEQVPTYHFEGGSDLATIPASLLTLLRQLEKPSA